MEVQLDTDVNIPVWASLSMKYFRTLPKAWWTISLAGNVLNWDVGVKSKIILFLFCVITQSKYCPCSGFHSEHWLEDVLINAYVTCSISNMSYVLHHCNVGTSEKLGVMLFKAKPSQKSKGEITKFVLNTEIITDYFQVSQ